MENQIATTTDDGGSVNMNPYSIHIDPAKADIYSDITNKANPEYNPYDNIDLNYGSQISSEDLNTQTETTVQYENNYVIEKCTDVHTTGSTTSDSVYTTSVTESDGGPSNEGQNPNSGQEDIQTGYESQVLHEQYDQVQYSDNSNTFVSEYSQSDQSDKNSSYEHNSMDNIQEMVSHRPDSKIIVHSQEVIHMGHDNNDIKTDIEERTDNVDEELSEDIIEESYAESQESFEENDDSFKEKNLINDETGGLVNEKQEIVENPYVEEIVNKTYEEEDVVTNQENIEKNEEVFQENNMVSEIPLEEFYGKDEEPIQAPEQKILEEKSNKGFYIKDNEQDNEKITNNNQDATPTNSEETPLETLQSKEFSNIPQENILVETDMSNVSIKQEKITIVSQTIPDELEITSLNDSTSSNYENIELNQSKVENVQDTYSDEVSNSLSAVSYEEKNNVKRPRGRPKKAVYEEDEGKTSRPRLGVKVPNRNLMSQIVSKAELETEIVERSRKKQQDKRKNVMLDSLSKKLAQKLGPLDNKTAPINTNNTNNNQEKDDNADLLAILEGEGDTSVEQEDKITPKQEASDDTNLKMIEREIALHQLQELPRLTPKARVGRRGTKPELKTLQEQQQVLQNENLQVAKSNKLKSPKPETKIKVEAALPEEDDKYILEQEIDLEPQVKVNKVLKTYSRKRKSLEGEISTPKKLFVESTDLKIKTSKAKDITMKEVPISNTTLSAAEILTPIYMTKSSRVIKKKVIWDPDEIPSRLSKKIIKVEPKEIDKTPKELQKEDKTHKELKKEVKTPKELQKGDKTPKELQKGDKTSKEFQKEEKRIGSKLESKEEDFRPLRREAKKEVKKNTEKSLAKKVEESLEKVPTPSKKGYITLTESDKNELSQDDKVKMLKKSIIKSPGLKKRLTEVDKLLMDEGAVNMLYDVNKSDKPKKTKKEHVDKADNEMTEKITGNLRKKSLTQNQKIENDNVGDVIKKKSKDTLNSSPPGSPGYNYQETSILIRRRSSSSLSSDGDGDLEKKEEKYSKKKSQTPKTKTDKSIIPVLEKQVNARESTGLKKQTKTENKYKQYKSFNVRKTEKLINLNFKYENAREYWSLKVLNDFTGILTLLAKDKDCLAVSVTSSSKTFSLGLDYRSLVNENEENRKIKATELTGAIRDLLRCLLTFPKVLVAGVEGECIGFGVTVLPLFDMVIASDTATFKTNYASLGCAPEAGFLLKSPYLSNCGLAAELLYTNNKIKADDAFRRGFVTRLCWPEKYQDELKSILQSISCGSKQSLEAIKQKLRPVLLHPESILDAEIKILLDHWTSAECQNKFSSIDMD